MKRWIWNILAALSLVCVCITAVSWHRVRGNRFDRYFHTSAGGNAWMIVSERSRVALLRISPWPCHR